MNARKATGLVVASAALLLLGAGVAQARDNNDDSEGYPSTQSSSQGADAGKATLENDRSSFEDAANGEDRPHGADGTESEFGGDPRLVEGPLGGLLKNGPLK
ncbi:MAG: hypothetical protein M3Z25_07500 [Actinomycetota bacterium]|nr:hypothetical protein [Actinomycetota bacterium]